MKLAWKLLALGVVAILCTTFVIYQLDYRGTYTANVTGTIMKIGEDGDPTLMQGIGIEPSEYIDTWDLFKHITPAMKYPSVYWGESLYMLKVTITSTNADYGPESDALYYNMSMPEGESIDTGAFEFKFTKIPAGQATFTFEIYEWLYYYEKYGELVSTKSIIKEIGP